ncbi:hypothetical protein [Massilia sp. DD77]|uniref:hypothetical protein n=1 Tax=Massilia sp. DD77 TaxID=3109349 RepID=UPI002FFD7C6E
MAIQPADIVYRLSGGTSNGTAAASVGGAKSTTVVAPGALFDTIDGTESSVGDIEYRCVYVHNAHPTLTMQNAMAWIPTNTPNTGTDMAIGVGSSAINGTEQSVANEGTAPAGVTFAVAGTLGAGVALGNIPPGQHRAVWLRRTVTAAAPASNDGCTLRATCDTAA